MLEQERLEKRALLAHIGIKAIDTIKNSDSIVDIMAKGYDIADELVEEPLRRANTLSEIRRKAEAHFAAKKAEPAVIIETGQTLTEAEAIFQESLNRVKS